MLRAVYVMKRGNNSQTVFSAVSLERAERTSGLSGVSVEETLQTMRLSSGHLADIRIV